MSGSPMKLAPLFTFHRVWLIAAFFLLMGMVASGCESTYVHLSGTAAMRVQVDVYKGPLADELPTQWANLSEVGNEFSLRLQQYNTDVRKDIAIDDYCQDSTLDGFKKWYILENFKKLEELEERKKRENAAALVKLKTAKAAGPKTADPVEPKTTKHSQEEADEYREIKKALNDLSLDCSILIALERDSSDLYEASIKQYTVGEALKAIELVKESIEESQKIIEPAKEAILESQDDIRTAENALLMNEMKINKLKAEIAEIKKQIAAEKAVPITDENKIKELEDVIAEKREEIKNAEGVVAENQEEIKKAKDKIATKREEIKNIKKAKPITFSGLMSDLNKVSGLFKRVNDFKQYDKICWGVNLTDAQRDSAYEEICSQVGKHLFVSAKARIASHYWSILSGIHYPNERKVRQQMANFANLSAQFSQELRYRADIILKQLDGLTKENASLALKLRNTSFNDFLNLYAWYRAADRPIPEELLSEGPYIFSAEQTRDRVRAMEMLYDYESWENINEVHANGRGEFSLALIKDRIGNWRLKSYESDPSKLLEAYTKVGTTLLESAASLAGGGSGSILAAENLGNIQNMTSAGAKMVAATQAPMSIGKDITQNTTTSNAASSTQQSGKEVTPKILFVAETSRKNTNQTLGLVLHDFSNDPAVKEYRDLLKWEETEKTIPNTCFENGELTTSSGQDESGCSAFIEKHQAEVEKYGARPLEGQEKSGQRIEIRKQYAMQLGQLFIYSQDQLQAHAKNIETLKP